MKCMKKSYKIAAAACFGGGLVCLTVGAAFHGLRMRPENTELFTLGVTMGIVMLCLSTLCIAAGIAVIAYGKRNSHK